MNNQVRSSVMMALNRMNGNPIAVKNDDSTMMANLQQMMICEDDDYQEQAEQQMRENLCSAYGMGEPSADKPFAYSNGVAIIPVHGTLINRYGGYYYGYVTGYNFIRSQRNAALMDSDVQAIIYDINSNGGEAAGCFELAQEMFDTRGVKPSLAVIDSNCYSAAYAIGSAADRMAVTPSGGAGSIGVISMHVDMSKMLEDIGIKVSIIKSGDHKADGNPFEPLSDSARASFQASVDNMRTDFVNLVAQNRNLDPKVVRDTEAMCYNATDAKAKGLIDEVATPTQAVAEFLSGPQDGPETTGANAMSFTQEQMDAAKAEAAASASATATTAERERISGIIGCDAAKTRPSMAMHLAFKTSMSAAEAGEMLAVAGEEKPAAAAPANPAAPAAPANPAADAGNSPFNAAMNNATHPEAGADAGENGTQEDKETAGLMAAAASVFGDNMA